MTQIAATTSTPSITIRREFDAPRELVWRAWTEPEQMKKWWGPEGYTCPFAKMDVRVGGTFLFAMRSPEGEDTWSTGKYLELDPVERMVWTNCFADAEGNVVPATVYGMGADIPLEMLVTVVLEDLNGRTRMILTHAGLPDTISADAELGWGTSLDKLEASLS